MVCPAFLSASVEASEGGVTLRALTTTEEASANQVITQSASNIFLGFFRDPAEDSAIQFGSMQADENGIARIAYFRDVHIAGDTSVSGPSDLDTWTATATRADNSVFQFITIQWRQQLPAPDTRTQCFVNATTGQVLVCGVTSAVIRWFMPAQCGSPGLWRWSFFYNGVAFSTPDHLLLPRLPPNTVAHFDQHAFNFFDANGDGIAEFVPYDRTCTDGLASTPEPIRCPNGPDLTKGEFEATVAVKGCFMTALVNILRYHGIDTDPARYNFIARQFESGIPVQKQKGYSVDGDTNIETFPTQFASGQGKFFVWLQKDRASPIDPAIAADVSAMDEFVCRNGPQILQVSDTHFVTLIGRDFGQPETAFLANNPLNGNEDQPFLAPAKTGRFFSGPASTFLPSTTSALIITAWSPIELLLTDPAGRRTGLEGLLVLQEIPSSTYEDFGLINGDTGQVDEDLRKKLRVGNPIDGGYRLRVLGTGSGTYDLDVEVNRSAGGGDLSTLLKVPIAAGVVHEYSFDFSGVGGTTLALSGGFDGGGQRPADVNRFLSYVTPTQTRNQLPAGTTSVSITVGYGATTIPATFQAVLNGADVSSAFQPEAGKLQTVTLPVASGSNTLVLSINGTLSSGRTATDTDRLVFLVN